MHIKDPEPDSSLLQCSCLYGALLCDHVYDCDVCERPDNTPESLAHTLKNYIYYGLTDDEKKAFNEEAARSL